jgi:hypothetical protein
VGTVPQGRGADDELMGRLFLVMFEITKQYSTIIKEIIMKRLVLFVFAALVSACSITPQIMYSGAPKPDDQVVVLTSEYTAETRNLVLSEFGGISNLGAAMILSIDKVEGKLSYGEYRNTFNDGGFKIHLADGEHTLVVSSNIAGAINPPRIPITFNSVGGHKYFVGQLLETEGLRYKFTPLIIDVTSNKRIFPERITWKPNVQWAPPI